MNRNLMSNLLSVLIFFSTTSVFASECILNARDYQALQEKFGYNPTLVAQNKNVVKDLNKLAMHMDLNNIRISTDEESTVHFNSELLFVGPNYKVVVTAQSPETTVSFSKSIHDSTIQTGERSNNKVMKMILSAADSLNDCY